MKAEYKKYVKLRMKVVSEIGKLTDDINDLKSHISSLEKELHIWEKNDLNNVDVCSNYEKAKLMLEVAQNRLFSLKNKLQNKLNKYNELDAKIEELNKDIMAF